MKKAFLLAVCVGCAPGARADSTQEALGEIGRCRAISAAAERLACYDRAVQRAVDAAQPKPEDFGRPAARPAEIPELSAMVREFGTTARGRALFILDNGQVWRQIDSDTTRIPEPAPGETLRVTIDRGLFDSYNLAIDGRNGAIKVRRVQ